MESLVNTGGTTPNLGLSGRASMQDLLDLWVKPSIYWNRGKHLSLLCHLLPKWLLGEERERGLFVEPYHTIFATLAKPQLLRSKTHNGLWHCRSDVAINELFHPVGLQVKVLIPEICRNLCYVSAGYKKRLSVPAPLCAVTSVFLMPWSSYWLLLEEQSAPSVAIWGCHFGRRGLAQLYNAAGAGRWLDKVFHCVHWSHGCCPLQL